MAPATAIEVLPDSSAVAARAADLVCATVNAKPRASLGLPTGGTPIPLYGELNRRTTDGSCDFTGALVYALDEFCDAHRATAGTNTQFYREHIRFRTSALHCPNPGATEPDVHIRAFAEAIRRGGGLDLCVLGIGENGHIAFNEPGSQYNAPARVVELTDTSRQAHAAAFGELDLVPRCGMTLGIQDILQSKAMLVLATGGHKAAIVCKAVEGPVSADVPASWLREHGNVRWLLDMDASRELTS